MSARPPRGLSEPVRVPVRRARLAQVAREFHDIPAWLPVLGNPFCERYGFADCAPGRAAGR